MIFYECFADKTFLECFGLTAKSLVGGHSFGRSRVSAKLRKSERSVGVIDEDPGASMDNYLKHLLLLPAIYKDDFLICIDDRKLTNRLIVLKPNLEALIVRIARDLRIDLTKQYNLPNTMRDLHEVLRIENNHPERAKLAKFVEDNIKHPTFKRLGEILK